MNDPIYKAAIKLERLITLDQLFLKKCKRGELDMIKKMVKIFDININATDRRKCSPLIIACRKGYTDIVQFLLQQPLINIKLRDENGFSALECAIWINKIKIVDLLLKTNKFNIDEKIPYGIFKNISPYNISILRGNKELIF